MEEKKKAPVAREQTTVRMPEELKERLQKEANRKGMSLSELILLTLDDYVNSHSE